MSLIQEGKVLAKYPCWRCGAEVEGQYFCPECASLQRIPEKTDYFACFDLPQRLQIDLKILEAKFHGLSRKFHPDFYQKRSAEEQTISLENAAFLNKAYRVLRDPLQRTEYLVRLLEGENVLPADAPSDLFDEIFELQESLEEIKHSVDPKRRAALRSALEETRRKFEKRQDHELAQLQAHFGAWDRLIDQSGTSSLIDEKKKSLGEMKRILSHRAYLERVLNDIGLVLDEERKEEK